MNKPIECYEECSCGKLTKNESGFCGNDCKYRFYRKISKLKNHVPLPQPKIADEYNTSLINCCQINTNLHIVA